MLGSLLKRLLRRASAAAESIRAQSSRADDAGWRQEALRLRELGLHRDTESMCRGVLERQPNNVDALNLLAAALLALGESRQGAAYLRRAAELTPSPAPWAGVAAVLAATGDINGAIECYRRALTLRADLPDASAALAALLKALGRYDEAEACCRAALQAGAQSAVIRQLLAGALFEQGRVDEAIACVRPALALDGRNAAAHSDLLRMLNYADAQDPLAVAREHRAWAERHSRELEAAAPAHDNAPDPGRKLRIGYVSPYFRRHAVTFFLEAALEHHDRQDFELMLYADVAQPDEYSKRLQARGAVWRNTLRLSDEELAQMVRNDGVDILVDLSGHTPGNRLLAFARRPAPVQVTWNGYPNTTGMQGMDYRITDAHCDPPGTTEHLHSETLLRLPSIYMAWRPPAEAPEPGPPPALASGRSTFGSFNSCSKLTPRLVELWSRILERVPGSRLLLLTIDGETARERVHSLFARHGIDAQRLDIRPRVTHEEFLATHREVDIALDAFPYHGTTTTCFSLWMGLPVVTLAGAVHASRVGATLLANLGMPQWIARDADAYVEIAARLAADRPALAQTRATLRSMLQRSPIADGRACARNLGAAYRNMWGAWCRTQSVALDAQEKAMASGRNRIIRSDYGPVIVNRNDTMIGKWIERDGAWEKDEIELLRWLLASLFGAESEIDILDIGANVGAHTIAFARFPFSQVSLHAFEAQREIFDLLVGTTALNHLTNVHCHHNAVSDQSGATIEYAAIDYDRPADFGCFELEAVARPEFDGTRLPESAETVKTVRIDDLDLRRVRLIKIDVEGMEHKVLAGAADTIARCRPVLFLEYPKADFAAIKTFLRGARYRSYYAQRPNILCVPSELDHRFEGAVPVEY